MEDSTEIRIHKTKKKFRSHVEGECFGCVKTFLEAFGLDGDDLTRKAVLFMEYGDFRGISDWYILQHYDKYKGKYVPFITYIEFNE